MPPAGVPTDVLGILLAALGGAVVGVERQWSGKAAFAGVRTFTFLGGLAGAAGWLWSNSYPIPAAILLAGAVAVVVAGYVAESRKATDATTEIAALMILAAGVLSGIGRWTLASGIVVVTAILLVEKSRLHSWVASISDTGLKAGFRFALMAVVILPLLPEGPYGPFGGVRPRELWMLVLLFSGISFLAYIIRSFIGAGFGYVVAGLLGGLISSTNVTFSFSRMNVTRSAQGGLALGVIGASTMMYFRVVAASAVLNAAFARALLPYLATPALLGTLICVYGLWRTRKAGKNGHKDSANPLQFRSALQMAALFQVVLFAVRGMSERFGNAGLLASGAILGLTDVDALTISMAKSAANGEMLPVAALAAVVGILSNNVLKLGVAIIFGRERYRILAAAGLAGLGAATVATIAFLRAQS